MPERDPMDSEPITAGSTYPGVATNGSVGAEPLARTPASGEESMGKYRFIAALGQGGMADVYLAVVVGPAGFSKLQVIKRLRPALADEPELRKMFLDEARLAARLNHRNVVQTNEVGLAEGQYFIAMEYLDGQPYHRLLAQSQKLGRPLPLGILIRILCDVLAGLHYAHELADYDGTPLGVVHRDISPQNVFITYDGQVKIVDFGIAKAARRAIETQAGVIKGKVAYMAAEQAFSPSSEVDRRADLYSVGVMLWEAIAGRRLWAGMSDPEIIARMLNDVPKIRAAKPDVPAELARVCDRALAREPGGRYPTAAAFRSDLEPMIERLGGHKITAEEIGVLLGDLFKEQRAELKATIDRRLALLQDEAPDTVPRPGRSNMALPRIALDSVPPMADDDATKTREIVRSVSDRPPHAVEPTPVQSTLSAVLTRPQSKKRALPVIATVVTAGALLAGIAWLVTRQSKSAPPQDPPPQVPTAATTAAPVSTQAAMAPIPSAVTSPPPGRDTIKGRIAATPGDARIFLDGAALPQNPFEAKMVKDGAVHRVQFEANGCLPMSRIVVFDKDFNLEVVLLPRPKSDGVGTGLRSKPDPYK